MNFGKIGLSLAAAAGAATLLAGCVIVDADVREDGWDRDHGRLTTLYGAEISPRGDAVSIIAPSNGCTNKTHFNPDVDDEGERRFDVRFRRVTEDHCKALVPDGERLVWSFAELGLPDGARVRVVNRISR